MKLLLPFLLAAGLLLPALTKADCLASNDPSKKIWTAMSQTSPHALRWHERLLVRMMLWRAERKTSHRVIFSPTADCDTIMLTNGKVLLVHLLESDYENLTVTPCEEGQDQKRTIPWPQVKYARRAGGAMMEKPNSPQEIQRLNRVEQEKLRVERLKNMTPAERGRYVGRGIAIFLLILLILVLLALLGLALGAFDR